MSQFVKELESLGIGANVIEEGKLAVLLALYKMIPDSAKAKTLFESMTFQAD